MKKQTTKSEQPIVTRAEKKDAVKGLIRELLAKKQLKHNDLIEEAANVYAQRYAGEDTENINDVRGRIGSVLDIMKKEEEVLSNGGMYALKAKQPVAEKKKDEVKTVTKTAKKKAVKEEIAQSSKEEVAQEEPKEKKTTKRGTKAKKVPEESPDSEEKKEEEVLPLPPAPLQPIAPVDPVTPEIAPEPIPESAPTAPKKRGRKAAVKTGETEEKPKAKKSAKKEKQAPMSELKEEILETFPVVKATETAQQESTALVEKPKAEIAAKNVVMDMSFLFGDVKQETKQEQKAELKQEQKAEVTAQSPEKKEAEKTGVKKAEEPKKDTAVKVATKTVVKPTEKPVEKADKQPAQNERRRLRVEKAPTRPLTADEKLREAYLRKLRSLGGDYFEYYSVYLLEKYSRKNGRRLEGLKVSGGEHDGGIDGEIELTDKLGFKETIYIQSKNWNPEKGDERLWVVGETLLQQFIGACACRQAKDGKQNCRGIFITTSRFTPDAKRILDNMSDKIVGYDGEDLYEAAKECEFGVIKKNGAWVLDEQLLSGEKAFFNMF